MAVGVFCLSLQLGESLSGHCKWGRRKKSGQQADCRMHPCVGVGDGCPVLHLAQGIGKEPFEVGPSDVMTNCDWDSQFLCSQSLTLFRPLPQFAAPVLYSWFLFPALPFPSHTRVKMNMS